MKMYLAGPMTGIPQFNIPAFDAAAAQLRTDGHEVVSPAELDGDVVRSLLLASPDGLEDLAVLTGMTWSDFLARDLKVIVDDGIEAIIVLSGWPNSRGARLETFVGVSLLGLPAASFDNGESLSALSLVQAWSGAIWDDVAGMVKSRVLSGLQDIWVTQ